MDAQIDQLFEEEEELKRHNEQLRIRAEKFGSTFNPLSLEEFRQYKVKKASETGKVTYLEEVLLPGIKSKQERKKAIEERKEKFFPEIKVNKQCNFDLKSDVNLTEQDVEIRENAWHLYGVDYMSNQKIRNYFFTNPHFKIEWLNDSSCNIVFKAAEEAIEAIKPHLKGTAEENSDQEIWHQLDDYEVDGVKRQLVCRLATNKDVKNSERSGRDSEYYKWLTNKKKFHQFVKARAHDELRKTSNREQTKTKKIVHPGQSKNPRKPKKEQQDDQSESSGVDSSSESESKPSK